MPTVRNLLILGLSFQECMEAFYVRAFERLGIQVTLFDAERSLAWCRGGRIRNRLTLPMQHLLTHRALSQFYSNPRWDAVLVFRGYMLAVDTIRECRGRADVPWTILNPDSPFELSLASSTRHVRSAIPEYDLYFIWSRSIVGKLHSVGCKRPIYLPCAYDESTHFPATNLDPSLHRTITLVGTYDRQRAQMMESVSDLPIRIYGGGWDRVSPLSKLRRKISGPVRGAALRSVITSSLACLNLLRSQNLDAHNMRTFEVPAMGGVLLTTRSEDQQEFFPDGEACLMFSTPDELRAAMIRLLANEIDTDHLRRNALNRSAGHTYVERARTILGHISQL